MGVGCLVCLLICVVVYVGFMLVWVVGFSLLGCLRFWVGNLIVVSAVLLTLLGLFTLWFVLFLLWMRCAVGIDGIALSV